MTTCKLCGKEIRYILGKGCSPVACDPEKVWFIERDSWNSYIDDNRNSCRGITCKKGTPGAKCGRTLHRETCEVMRKNREREKNKGFIR